MAEKRNSGSDSESQLERCTSRRRIGKWLKKLSLRKPERETLPEVSGRSQSYPNLMRRMKLGSLKRKEKGAKSKRDHLSKDDLSDSSNYHTTTSIKGHRSRRSDLEVAPEPSTPPPYTSFHPGSPSSQLVSPCSQPVSPCSQPASPCSQSASLSSQPAFPSSQPERTSQRLAGSRVLLAKLRRRLRGRPRSRPVSRLPRSASERQLASLTSIESFYTAVLPATETPLPPPPPAPPPPPLPVTAADVSVKEMNARRFNSPRGGGAYSDHVYSSPEDVLDGRNAAAANSESTEMLEHLVVSLEQRIEEVVYENAMFQAHQPTEGKLHRQLPDGCVQHQSKQGRSNKKRGQAEAKTDLETESKTDKRREKPEGNSSCQDPLWAYKAARPHSYPDFSLAHRPLEEGHYLDMSGSRPIMSRADVVTNGDNVTDAKLESLRRRLDSVALQQSFQESGLRFDRPHRSRKTGKVSYLVDDNVAGGRYSWTGDGATAATSDDDYDVDSADNIAVLQRRTNARDPDWRMNTRGKIVGSWPLDDYPSVSTSDPCADGSYGEVSYDSRTYASASRARSVTFEDSAVQQRRDVAPASPQETAQLRRLLQDLRSGKVTYLVSF